MKKMLMLIFATVILLACSKKKPFESIKKGMTAAKVIALVGEPDEKIALPNDPRLAALPGFFEGFSTWTYEKDNVIIALKNDTVLKIQLDMKSLGGGVESRLAE